MTHFCRFYGEMFYNLGRQYLISPGVHARDNLGNLKPFFVKKRIMLSCRKRPTTLKALWFHILWFRFIYTMVIYYICKTFAFNVKKTISCFNLKIWSWLNLRRHVEVMKQIHFSSHIKKILIQLCFNPPVQFTCNSLVKSTQSFTFFQLEIRSWKYFIYSSVDLKYLVHPTQLPQLLCFSTGAETRPLPVNLIKGRGDRDWI